jgi:hypothetical protein
MEALCICITLKSWVRGLAKVSCLTSKRIAIDESIMSLTYSTPSYSFPSSISIHNSHSS